MREVFREAARVWKRILRQNGLTPENCQGLRLVNLSADQVESIEHILKSTIPADSPAFRTRACDRSVGLCEARFGQAIDNPPFLENGGIRLTSRFNCLESRKNHRVTSEPYRAPSWITTCSGSSPSVCTNPRGALTKETTDPVLIPSFFGKGVPE